MNLYLSRYLKTLSIVLLLNLSIARVLIVRRRFKTFNSRTLSILNLILLVQGTIVGDNFLSKMIITIIIEVIVLLCSHHLRFYQLIIHLECFPLSQGKF